MLREERGGSPARRAERGIPAPVRPAGFIRRAEREIPVGIFPRRRRGNFFRPREPVLLPFARIAGDIAPARYLDERGTFPAIYRASAIMTEAKCRRKFKRTSYAPSLRRYSTIPRFPVTDTAASTHVPDRRQTG